MDISALSLAAVLLVAPKKTVIPRETLERLASNITLAAELSETPFRGPQGREAAALALVAIARHESAFLPSVAICNVNGDGGRSVSPFQLMRGAAWDGHARSELCNGGPLAAYLALRVLNVYPAKCFAKTPQAIFRSYASGSCSAASQAATDICESWVSISSRMGLVGASCSKSLPIRWATVPQADGTTPGA